MSRVMTFVPLKIRVIKLKLLSSRSRVQIPGSAYFILIKFPEFLCKFIFLLFIQIHLLSDGDGILCDFLGMLISISVPKVNKV